MPKRPTEPFRKIRALQFLEKRGRIRAFVTVFVLIAFFWTMPIPAQAGDILRGGATAKSTGRQAQARSMAGAEAAQAAKVRAQDRLARTTKAVNDMRSLQAAARAAANSNHIPNGLAEGGLKVLAGPNAKWEGADAPAASDNTVGIRQTASQALLHWETFHVGRDTTVNFDQSAGGADAGKWIAFNKVFDPAQKPSEIRGRINAQGQVYIINQNGIVFGAGSQVNARTLVASSLPINEKLVKNGLLNNREAEFLFAKDFVNKPPAVFGDVTVEPGALLTSPEGEGGNGGRVMLVGANVHNAGEISTPSGQTILAAGLQVGAAPHAESDPSLRGLDVWVGDTGTYAGSVTNSGLVESQRGSILAVGKRIKQSGVMESSTSVNLNGRIDLLASHGAVGFPGYDSSFQPPFLNRATGIVEFSPGSTTRILPDISSGKKIPGTKLAQPSQVNIEGLGIHFAGGSSLIATSGRVGIRAGTWPFLDTNNDGTVSGAAEAAQQISGGRQRFLLSGGQVNIANGALLDASGTMEAYVPLGQNFVAIQLRGSELADSPLQRSGNLRGKPLLVDLRRSGTYGGRGWIGTPLGDLTGFANISERDISQLTTRGGSITISAGDSVVASTGATIDVSGGFFAHEGGLVRTSRLLRDAKLVDMHNATPDVTYDGVYYGVSSFQSAKWGISETFSHALAPLGGGTERRHVEGAPAGTLSISAPKMAMGAELLGQSITGPRQQLLPAGQGTLRIKFQGETKFSKGTDSFDFLNHSPDAPHVVFANGTPPVAPFAFEVVEGVPIAFPFAAGGTFTVPSKWWEEDGGGFGNIEIENSEGDATVPGGTPLLLPGGGSLALAARNISVESDISVPAGAIALTAYNYTPFAYARDSARGLFLNVAAPAPVKGQGVINVSPGVQLDVAGHFADERPSSTLPYQEKILPAGGSVSLTGYSVLLGKGSLIDASGGVRARSNGKFQYGNGGSISILAGRDPVLSTTVGGRLQLGGTLQAYSAAKGGSLALQANTIQIGGSSEIEGDLLIQPDFFRKGGFTNYSLRGIGTRALDGSLVPGVAVAAGTAVEPVAESWRHVPYAGPEKLALAPRKPGERRIANSDSVSELESPLAEVRSLGIRRLGKDTLFPVLLPEGVRQPASLTLAATGYDDPFTDDRTEALGILDFQTGAKILTDAGASVRLSGDVVHIAGEIRTPGGNIEIAGRSSFRLPQTTLPTFALPTVLISAKAHLSVAGKTLSLDDPLGWNAGIIHPGGTIRISGNLLGEAGSILDASGTSATLDVHASRLNPAFAESIPANAGLTSIPWHHRAVPVRLDSDGGLISIAGSQMLYMDSTLSAHSGGPTAAGGRLDLSSGGFYGVGESRTGADTNLIVTAGGSASRIADTSALAGRFSSVVSSKDPDTFLRDAFSAPSTGASGIGFFAADRFEKGGFDHLELGFKYFKDADPIPYGGNLEFLDPVSLEARGSIRLAGGGVIRSTHPVSISAPYVAIGQPFREPLHPLDVAPPFRKFNASNGSSPIHHLAPTTGTGLLNVSGQLIDLGTLATQGVNFLSLFAYDGEIRGDGVLSVAGDVILQASQIYPVTLGRLEVFAYDTPSRLGTVTIIGDQLAPVPLSAGGQLGVYASLVRQAGVLRAPLGSIELGWDGRELNKPENRVVGNLLAPPRSIAVGLADFSVTSVSGFDPLTGKDVLFPFGMSPNGQSWIDPRGVDITTSGLPNRGVTLQADAVYASPGSIIDTRGGGELMAYRWIPGPGGNSDLLGTATEIWTKAKKYSSGDLVLHSGKTWSARSDIDPADFTSPPEPGTGLFWTHIQESFAIFPERKLAFSPLTPFNTGPNAGLLAGDPGYVAPGLKTGQVVYLSGQNGIEQGFFSLFPKRYALLPGGALIVPADPAQAGTGSVRTAGSNRRALPNHSAQTGVKNISGYVTNGFNTTANPVQTKFEVLSAPVIAERAQYQTYLGTPFFKMSAAQIGLENRGLLPEDSAPLRIQGNQALALSGFIFTKPNGPGKAGAVDISSDSPLLVSGRESQTGSRGQIVLNSEILNSWNAGSLLIGGFRKQTPAGFEIEARTGKLKIDTPGLSSGEVLLISKSELDIADGSSISTSGSRGPGSLFAIEGDGAFASVSASETVVSRSSPTGAEATLRVGKDTRFSGDAVVLDSSRSATIDPSLSITANSLALGAGQISLVFQPRPGGLEGSLFPTHLAMEGAFLSGALASEKLKLQSYTSIDMYSNGPVTASAKSLDLLSSGLRVYTAAGSTIALGASDILLSNPNGAAALAPPASPSGSLALSTNGLSFGKNNFSISGVEALNFSAAAGVAAIDSGTFSTSGSLKIAAPSFVAGQAVGYSLNSNGRMELAALAGNPTRTPGLGATLALEGSSVSIGSQILLPAGSLRTTATGGSIIISGEISVAGASQAFFDQTRFTNGGDVVLDAKESVQLLADSRISVAASAGGGDAGSLAIQSPHGPFVSEGTLSGSAHNGRPGAFSLDTASLADFDVLSQKLTSSGFNRSLDFRVRSGDIAINNAITAANLLLAADGGSISVNNLVDASGETGGRIELVARNNLTLSPTASLSVAAQRFSNAGKGGHIHLEAGSAVDGSPNTSALLDLQEGSNINLSVSEFAVGDYLTAGSSAFHGKFEGTLHLRAPRMGNDVRVAPIDSAITGASAISVEPFRIYEPAGGIMNIALRNTINTDNISFMEGEAAMFARLLRNSGTIRDVFIMTPGVEIMNRSGDLTLGLANNSNAGTTNIEAHAGADWDLSSFRYGSKSSPGILTLRAKDDLIFNNSLSDGFEPIAQGNPANFADNGHSLMWLATPQPLDPKRTPNLQSWSYRLAAGSDFSSTSHRRTASASALAGKGSILVGEFYPAVPNPSSTGTAAAIGRDGQTADSIRISNTTTNRGTRYEVVRTGTGDIDISAARDVQLRNPFATVYTSGIALPSPTRIFKNGDFSLPQVVRPSRHPEQGNLGAVQQPYNAYYTMAGGMVSITAGNDIGRFTRIGTDTVADASRQLPTNWLYRRGQVDPATGLFSEGGVGTGGLGSFTDPSASTTWWVDFSNFFSGFGALGGGTLSLAAGRDLVNADAYVPTNARMAGLDNGIRIAPSMQNLHQLGGGDLHLTAGRNIDGGSFQVDRGSALLNAGSQVTTNSAQSPSLGNLGNTGQNSNLLNTLVWLPVTLYGSDSSFTVNARGDILIGPVTNPFLLPQGLNNKFWYKTQFHTISPASAVSVNSFGGSITHRLAATLPDDSLAIPILEPAYRQSSALSLQAAGYYRPWLRLSELNTAMFRSAATVALPSLKSTAFGGDIHVVGPLNLFPSPSGGLELLSTGTIHGLNPTGITTTVVDDTIQQVTAWTTTAINLSDANPSSLSGATTPYSIQAALGARDAITLRDTPMNPFLNFDASFKETGAYTGEAAAIDVKSALHSPSLLHSGNPAPLRLYAGNGDISGLTLYSAKKVHAVAQRDISDVAFYLQHTGDRDVSIVSAGRDVIPFNENSPRRATAGDVLLDNIIVDEAMDTVVKDAIGDPVQTKALPGDIQIGGRGVLEILAGRNVDLGTGPNLVDGRGNGITSIGRSRNPFLPFDGAEIVVLAGVGGISGGPALGLAKSALNFSALGSGIPGSEIDAVNNFKNLFRRLARIGEMALESGDYSAGKNLIEQIFGTSPKVGDLFTRARDIRTASNGSITIAAPGGGVTMASDIFGNPLTPPGIVTEYGGAVSILTDGDVNIGQARIFTLRGGDLTIWSSRGDIAAGNAPKTVVTAPPTRVLIDATSADIQTDLGGLATGGGIGVLAAVENVEPGAVNLIAPDGTVDAGDAGIRATGDIKIAAAAVVNADNISAGGTSTGVPASPSVAAPNIGGLSSGAATSAAASSAASQVTQQAAPQEKAVDETPSMISVEILGYGGGDGQQNQGEEDEPAAEG